MSAPDKSGAQQLGVQEKGYDTVDANRALGLPDDCREYSSVSNILSDLDIKSVRLLVSCTCAVCIPAKAPPPFLVNNTRTSCRGQSLLWSGTSPRSLTPVPSC